MPGVQKVTVQLQEAVFSLQTAAVICCLSSPRLTTYPVHPHSTFYVTLQEKQRDVNSGDLRGHMLWPFLPFNTQGTSD
jgi:hypothetical protein